MPKPIEELHEWVYNYMETELGAQHSKDDKLVEVIDSLDVLNIIMEVEELFLPPSVMIEDKTVQDWLKNKDLTIEHFLDNIVISVKEILEE
jgi:acyl carrier protein